MMRRLTTGNRNVTKAFGVMRRLTTGNRNVTKAFGVLEAHIGKRAPPGPWFAVDQERITRFGATILDEQWIHSDPERAARESPWGATIAHGNLIMCLAPYLPRADGGDGDIPGLPPLDGLARGLNYGWNKVRFPAPVPCGARIRVARTLSALEVVPLDALQLVVEFAVEVEGSDKPCCVAEAVSRAIFAPG